MVIQLQTVLLHSSDIFLLFGKAAGKKQVKRCCILCYAVKSKKAILRAAALHLHIYGGESDTMFPFFSDKILFSFWGEQTSIIKTLHAKGNKFHLVSSCGCQAFQEACAALYLHSAFLKT